MRKEGFTLEVDGDRIVGVLENPGSEKLMILSHGFTGSMDGPQDTFVRLSQRLQQEGYAVMRFNFRGTPPSGMNFIDMTTETETKDLKAIIGYAKSRGYDKIGLLGESMGGAVVLKAYDEDINVMVFWYSDFSYLDDCGCEELLSDGRKKELEKNGYITVEDGFRVGRTLIEEFATLEFYDLVPGIGCPVLFMHGDSDKDVPLRQSEKAHELARCPKELVVMEGVGHCFSLDDEKPHPKQDEAIDVTIDFLKRHF